jgi:hypothetical protein
VYFGASFLQGTKVLLFIFVTCPRGLTHTLNFISYINQNKFFNARSREQFITVKALSSCAERCILESTPHYGKDVLHVSCASN